MDVCLAIKQRLEELGLEQRDLAAAAKVTESYISQLLTGKKLPPEPSRTDIYEKIGKFLKLPSGKLSKLADHQRRDVLKRNLDDPPKPLLKEVRELVLRKCAPVKERQIRVIFEKQPFGELERLVTQKLLDVVKTVAKTELESETWLRSVARLSGRSYEAMRVSILEFLDTDVFNVSNENCVFFLDPLIESWDIDLATFGMEIVLNRRLIPGYAKKFEFVEREPAGTEDELGLTQFLRQSVNGGATEEEVEFLRRLRFKGKHPTPLYYYRELQNLRDPLHFRERSTAAMRKRRDPDNAEKQMQLHSRKNAIQRWSKNKTAPRKRSKA
ncbi:MAG TPA: helix-turn-helix transcriptional regulator [Candidatus Acidoferrum sp.]|nr:helix-turn-helix transcriptional regulator [Candidatus Acidoferrum sp.]